MGTQTRRRVVRMKRSSWATFQLFDPRLKVCPVLLISIFAFARSSVAQSDWPKLAEKLSNQLSGSTEEKRGALYQIRNIRTPEASRLALPALRDTEAIVRATAADSVVFLPTAEAASALLPLLDDQDPFVRTEAAYALGTAGDAVAARPLIRLLESDKIMEVRDAAAVALGRLGDLSAVPAFVSILKKKPSEKDQFLRRSAARSIGQIAHFQRTGKTKVVTPQNFLPPKYKETANRPMPVADSKAFDEARDVLVRTLENQKEAEDTRRESAFALGAIGDPKSINVLESLLSSRDPYLAEICKEALMKLQPANDR